MKFRLCRIVFIIMVVNLSFNFEMSAQGNGSAFGAPVIKVSSMAGQNAVLLGGRFGWLVNNNIVLGFGIYGLSNNVKSNMVDPVSGQDVLLGFNCGGIELEYIIDTGIPVNFSIDMLCAGAGVTYSVPDKSVAHTSYFSQNLLLWEPQFNAEFKIAGWFHLDAGISYRIITSFKNYYQIGPDDIKGMSALLTFKFGSY